MTIPSLDQGESSSINSTRNGLTQILGAHVRSKIERKIAGSNNDDTSLWIPYINGWNGCYSPTIARKELSKISNTELGRKAWRLKTIKWGLILALLGGGGYEAYNLTHHSDVVPTGVTSNHK